MNIFVSIVFVDFWMEVTSIIGVGSSHVRDKREVSSGGS